MIWNIQKSDIDEYGALEVSELFKHILKNREITPESARKLMEMPISLLDTPTGIPGAMEAATRIFELTHNKKKPFVVFADYDVDGMTAGYIMTDFLLSIGCPAMVKYPERSEGYGLSVEFANELIKSGVPLTVITVDNGVTANKAIKKLREHGIETIVTDHHERGYELPDCIICDPWLTDEPANGDGKGLCGAAVAWKVCMIIEELVERESGVQTNICEKYLPYVGIGTVADVMPMTDENRALVKMALSEINKRNPVPFIKSLKDIFDLNTVNAKDIGWSIAPKLNSSSRMGDTQLAAMSLFETEEAVLNERLTKVVKMDKKRKEYTDKAIEEALEYNEPTNAICLFDASSYPQGICGIIAGKLAETYQKPAIVYFGNVGNELQCSCRSTPWLDIKSIINIEAQKGNAKGAMGHAQACGAVLYKDKIEDFIRGTNETISTILEELNVEEAEEEEIFIDSEISLKDINKNIQQEINSIPYWKNIPLLSVMDIKVKKINPFKTDKGHLILEMTDGQNKAYALGWYMGKDYEDLGSPKKISIAGELEPAKFIGKFLGLDYNDPVLMIKYLKTA